MSLTLPTEEFADRGRLRNGYLGGYRIDGRWTVTAKDLREYRRRYPQRMRKHA